MSWEVLTMKLKQRFFDLAVFRKDIIRFAPAWGLYLIGMLAVLLTTINDNLNRIDNGLFYALQFLNTFTGSGSLVNLFYAAVVSQLLFGDLFNSRMCNALHALPLRRECWFTTHVAAGLLFSLVPNFIISLCMTPLLGQFWYTSFLWLLGTTLSYLFYFGVSVLCMQLTGSRVASLLAYGFANFCILLPMWYLAEMYVPLLYGVNMDYDKLHIFCPSIQLTSDPSYFTIIHPQTCPCHGKDMLVAAHTLLWGGLGKSWGYMVICAGIGLVFLSCALLLYRIRRLETAGDFVAFRPMRPVFWVLFSLSCGALCQLFVDLMFSYEAIRNLFLLLGLVCGFFVAQMLLDRSIKVFNRRRLIKLGIFLAAFAFSFLLTKLDPIGITRYVPKTHKVANVTISADYILNPNSFGNEYFYYASTNSYNTSDPAEIEKIIQGHKNLAKEGPSQDPGRTSQYTIHYELSNGTTLTRYYSPVSGSDGCLLLWEVLNQPKAVLGYETLEEMKESVLHIQFANMTAGINDRNITGDYLDTLLDAIWLDAQAGNLLQDSSYHQSMHTSCSRQDRHEIAIRYMTADGTRNSIFLTPLTCSENVSAWIEENLEMALSFFAQRNPYSFALYLNSIHIGQTTLERTNFPSEEDIRAFAEALYRDLDNGYVSLTTAGSVTVRFDLSNTTETVHITDTENSECYPYLEKLMNG